MSRIFCIMPRHENELISDELAIEEEVNESRRCRDLKEAVTINGLRKKVKWLEEENRKLLKESEEVKEKLRIKEQEYDGLQIWVAGAKKEKEELLRKLKTAEIKEKDLMTYECLCHKCCSELMWEDDMIMVSCTNPECNIRFQVS